LRILLLDEGDSTIDSLTINVIAWLLCIKTNRQIINRGFTDINEVILALFISIINLIAKGLFEKTSLQKDINNLAHSKIKSDKYIFAISYADVTLDYKPGLGDIFSSGSAKFAPVIFSAQYNGEKISLTSEYYFSKNIFKNFGPYYPDYSPITTNYYLQAAYRLSNKWQTTLRYDVNYLNKDDRSGSQFERVGLPSHMGYTKDWMFGLRWDITPSIMVRGEYHYINGTSWISAADNPDRIQTEQYWDMFALQLSYRF